MSRIEKYNVPSWPVRKKKNKTISKSYTMITRSMHEKKRIILLVTEMMPIMLAMKIMLDNVKFQILKDHSYLTLIKVYCKLEYLNKFTK